MNLEEIIETIKFTNELSLLNRYAMNYDNACYVERIVALYKIKNMSSIENVNEIINTAFNFYGIKIDNCNKLDDIVFKMEELKKKIYNEAIQLISKSVNEKFQKEILKDFFR